MFRVFAQPSVEKLVNTKTECDQALSQLKKIADSNCKDLGLAFFPNQFTVKVSCDVAQQELQNMFKACNRG